MFCSYSYSWAPVCCQICTTYMEKTISEEEEAKPLYGTGSLCVNGYLNLFVIMYICST